MDISDREGSVSRELADMLEGYSEPAILVDPEYRILVANTPYQDLYSQEGGLCDRFCYEVSHGNAHPCDEEGEYCPLRLARESGEPQRVLHVHHSPRGDEHVEVEGRPVFDEQGNLHYFIEIIRKIRAASVHPEGAGLVGRSSSFNHMLGLIQRVAPSGATALLLGESGTGKELVAQAIHDQSPRRQGLFVPLECSGLSESLFESELFGHEKGAFTGANVAKEGLVEAARGGTLFLDEVGDIPLPLQVKLLRLLETGSYRRVGGLNPRQADFRLICATHRDLKQLVSEGRFRQDLYFRINTFPIRLPPLRERMEDLPLLADTLLSRLQVGTRLHLSSEALEMLASYDFPGNIRELRNVLERASLMADGDTIYPSHLPEECFQAQQESACEEVVSLEEMERQYLQRISAQHQGDRRTLAEKLGISERTLFRKLQRLKHD
jgi:transcriptional regulator with PAS, ATPase and Fis domain